MAELCQVIDHSARTIDSQLPRPARWRGQLRRELLGYCAGAEAIRYRDTFDWMVCAREPVTEGLAIEIHQRAVGWRDYRTCHLWVDHGYRHPEPEEIPMLMRLTFARLNDADRAWPVPARAIGLHLDLLTAHAFTDGNGRTARLAATGVLARHGYKSTVITAVEQFFHPAPRGYLEALDHYRFARACRTRTIEQLLVAMAARSAAAVWARDNGLSAAQAAAPDQDAYRWPLAQLWRIEMEERDAQDETAPADLLRLPQMLPGQIPDLHF